MAVSAVHWQIVNLVGCCRILERFGSREHTVRQHLRKGEKADSGTALKCDIIEKVRIKGDICRDTYRRSEGSPLTLFTATLAQSQRTLQIRGQKSQTGMKGSESRNVEMPEFGYLPPHLPLLSVGKKCQNVNMWSKCTPYGTFKPHQQTSEPSFAVRSKLDCGIRAELQTPAIQTPH